MTISKDEIERLQEAFSTKGINYCATEKGHAWDCGWEDPKPEQKCMCGQVTWEKRHAKI